MKRSGPIARKTPLVNKKPIKRTPSAAKPASNRSKIPKSVREAVERRSGGKCEAAVVVACRRKGGHLHHKLMRSQGGKHAEANLIDVCLICHHYIHHHTGWAYENGYLIRSGAV